jgi:hypothetical protein
MLLIIEIQQKTRGVLNPTIVQLFINLTTAILLEC